MNRRTFLKTVGSGMLVGSLAGLRGAARDRSLRRPNVLLILCDDMGFSDLGCFGSEIDTPSLDRLAAGGLRMVPFYNAARCCPTRASLLTGLYQHQAGVGAMDGNGGTPEYQGFLNDRCMTIAEVLKGAGYNTYMTDAFTDYAVEFLDQQVRLDKPFFLYLACTAPHWPLHAFPADIAKYRGRYKAGWDPLRETRYRRQLELGLFDKPARLSPRSPEVPAWEQASEAMKEEFDLEMAIYAAMIDRMDRNIGRVVDKLKTMGQFEDTLILFLSDNGGCHTTPSYKHLQGRPGGPNSFPCYGFTGANVSNVPFRLQKQFIHEGGIATPFIAHWPRVIEPSRTDSQPGHIIDIMPTLIGLCGAQYPAGRDGKEMKPLQGIRLRLVFEGKRLVREAPLYWEHVGNRGVRIGDWKLAAKPDLEWELYNMAEDRAELNDLSDRFPEKKKELLAIYVQWAQDNRVRLWRRK